MKKIFLCCMMILAGSWLLGQGGAWLPSNADFSYPRTLCKLNELDSIRAYLYEPEIYSLYVNLHYQAVNQGVPSVLTDDATRRIIAHVAKNCAFIYLLNRKPVSGGLDTLSPTDKAYFRDKSLLCLSRINTNVEPFPTGFDSYLWRSNEIADNLIAWDLLKGAGVPDSNLEVGKNLLVEYLGNLHAETTEDLFGFSFFSSRVNNHALRTASVFGLGAVVLNHVTSTQSDRQPLSWLHTGLGHQEDVLWRNSGRQSEPGILMGYAEGPHYFKFGGKHMLEFNHAMGNFLPDTVLGIQVDGNSWQVRNPWYDTRYHLLYEWMTRIRMGDGRMPPLEDSFSDHGFPEMALTENGQWNCPMYYSKWSPDQTIGLWRQLRGSTDDLVADYIASRTPPQPATFGHMQVLPESGDLIFRSSWDSNAVWFHMYAQNGRARTSGVGHNQADEASFMLQAFGEYLAFDPGYLKWSRRAEVGKAEDHNLILVNGLGANTGSIGSANGADAFIRRSYEGKYLCLGDVETSYQGANILRSSLFVRDRYMLLGDLATAGSNKEFEWRLHGSGLAGGDSISGEFELDSLNGRAYWLKNGVTLMAQVIGGNGGATYHSLNHHHELTYDSLVPHTAFLARQTSTTRGVFLAGLFPYVADSPSVTFWGGSNGQAFRTDWGGYQDFGLTRNLASAQSGLGADLTLLGDYGVYSIDSLDDFCFLVLQGGTQLGLGNQPSVQLMNSAFLVLEQISATHYKGFYHGPAGNVVNFENLSFTPLSAIGAVGSFAASGANSIAVTFSGTGEFELLDSLILSVENGWDNQVFTVFPNPASHFLYYRVEGEQGKEGTIWLRDMDGRIVYENDEAPAYGTLNTHQLANGVYWLIYKSETNHFTKRVVLMRE